MALSTYLVRLELLEAVTADLLLRFLRPFTSYLASRGVPLEGGAVSEKWREHLHAALNDVDPAMPAELQQSLVDVADLASEGAHDHVLAVAKGAPLRVLDGGRGSTPEDVAFEVFLDHPNVFREAHARTQTAEAKRFVEFTATSPKPLPPADLTAKRGQLARVVGDWFRGRNRTGFCEVRVTDAGETVSFVIIHGRPPRNHGAIESDERRTRVTYVPDKHDLVVFDRATGRLAVNAQFAGEQDLYRRALGRVFWGDDEHFVAAPIYTADPLVEEGASVLQPHGIPGLEGVELRALKVVSPDPEVGVLSWKGRDLGSELASPVGQVVLRHGEIRHFELAMKLSARSRSLKVEVDVPTATLLREILADSLVRSRSS